MEYRPLEITLNLDVNRDSRMDAYGVVIIDGHPQTKQKIPVYKDCGSNPKWNYTMKSTAEEAAANQKLLNLTICLVSDRFFGDIVIWQVLVPIKEFLDCEEKVFVCDVRLLNGKVKGTLKLCCKIGEKFSVPVPAPPHETEKAESAGYTPQLLAAYPCSSTPPGAYQQPAPPQGAHQQPAPQQGAHQQPAPPQGAHQQPAPPQGAHQQPAPPQGAHQQPAPPQGAYQQPAPPQGAYQHPAPPQGAYQQPAPPQGAYPLPAWPQGAYPLPAWPQGVYPPPAWPHGAYPLPAPPGYPPYGPGYMPAPQPPPGLGQLLGSSVICLTALDDIINSDLMDWLQGLFGF